MRTRIERPGTTPLMFVRFTAALFLSLITMRSLLMRSVQILSLFTHHIPYMVWSHFLLPCLLINLAQTLLHYIFPSMKQIKK